MAFIKVDFFSQSLFREVTFHAIMPDPPSQQQKEENPHYQRNTKTLYMLHGLCGSSMDWIHYTQIHRVAKDYNLAVIFPSGENSFYLDGKGMGKAYSKFIGEELVAYTRQLFHLSPLREDTFIGGLSMGGFGAIRNGLKYHETLGKIVGLSSALIVDHIKDMKEGEKNEVADYDYYYATFGDLTRLEESENNPAYLVKKLLEEKEAMPQMYLACGAEDFLIENNREFHSLLLSLEVPHLYTEGQGAHDWKYWDYHLEPAVQWLLQNEG